MGPNQGGGGYGGMGGGGGGWQQPGWGGQPSQSYGQSGYGMGGGQNFGAMTNAGGGSWGSGGQMGGMTGQGSPGQTAMAPPPDQAFRQAFGMGVQNQGGQPQGSEGGGWGNQIPVGTTAFGNGGAPGGMTQPQSYGAQGGSMQYNPKMSFDPAPDGGMTTGYQPQAPRPGPPPFTGPPDQTRPPFNPHPLPVWGPKPPFNPSPRPMLNGQGMGQMVDQSQDPYSQYRPGGMRSY